MGSGADMGGGGDPGVCGFQADYPGVPCPDPEADTVPTGIMPTLPTPNSAPGWEGYHPVTIPTPAAAECTVTFGAGEDVPGNVVLAPGEVVCFTGMATAANTIDVDASACTAQEPCWLTGHGSGGIAADGLPAITVSGQHLLIDGLELQVSRHAVDLLGGAEYITVRGNTIVGDESDGGGAGIDIAAAEGEGEIRYVMVYGNSLDKIGPSDGGPLGGEAHQVRPSWYARYVWVVDNQFGSSDGDAIQCGNSKTPQQREGEGMNQAKSPHYVWIAGNRQVGVSENFVDLKNSYHVIISSNEVESQVRETTLILSQDSEGFWTGYHWAIANRLRGGGSECIGVRGNEENFYGPFTDFNYVIGNVAFECNAMLSFQSGNSQTAEVETYVLYNTLVSNTQTPYTTRAPVYKVQNRQEKVVEFVGNIFYGSYDPPTGSLSVINASNYLTETFRALDNLYYQVDGLNVPLLSEINATALDEDGNISADPLFVDEGGGDFSLAAGSPARSATSRTSAAFDQFEAFYGIDLRAQLGLDGLNNMGADQSP